MKIPTYPLVKNLKNQNQTLSKKIQKQKASFVEFFGLKRYIRSRNRVRKWELPLKWKLDISLVEKSYR